MDVCWMEAGQVVGVHGVRGELKVRPWCDGADFLLPFRRFALQPAGAASKRICAVESSRTHQGFVLLKLEGIDTREVAQGLRDAVLWFDRADVRLPEGKYFLADLIGLTVEEENGTVLGTLTEVFQPPAHDVYHVSGGPCEHDIPAVPPFVQTIDLERRRVIVRLIEGM